MLKGKKITVGVTGGIAAYKSAELVSWLSQRGAEVRVVMTEAATHFISPLTMATLSHCPVGVDILDEHAAVVPHIQAADCDLFIVAPATANLLAKAAHGLADDLLSAALLATLAPVLACPAMNVHMYENPATQANLALLRQRGWLLAEPDEGWLACGAVGKGRMAEPEQIERLVCQTLLPQQSLAGVRVLVTAGPTYEYIDPVRFIGNRSSGKMGAALAAAAQQAGAAVTLVLGPCAQPDLAGAKNIRVTSAQDMHDAVWAEYAQTDIVIMAAAVADYRPLHQAERKIKKGGEQTIQLVQNPDILASLGAAKGKHFLVGFAAETNDLTAYASVKLQQKNLDLIVANNVATSGAGFDVDTNIVTLLSPGSNGIEQEELPLLSKAETARRIIEAIVRLRGSRDNILQEETK